MGGPQYANRPRRRLGDLLLEGGLVDEGQLKRALEAQRANGRRLGTNLLMMGALSEKELAEFLSEQLGLPALHDLSEVELCAVTRVPLRIARQHRVLPVRLEGGRLWAALADPSDEAALDAVAAAAGCAVHPIVAPELVVSYGLNRFYDSVPEPYEIDAEAVVSPAFRREFVLEL